MSAPAELIPDANGVRARVTACLGWHVGAAVSLFGPKTVGGASNTTRHCLTAATDCDAVLHCFGWARDACGEDECQGSTATRCSVLDNHLRARSTEDCADHDARNHQCTIVDEGKGVFATCNSGPCRGNRCEGDVRVICSGDIEIREDCALNGSTCVSGEATGNFCALPDRCDQDHCVGNTAVRCRDGHVVVRQECAELVERGRCQGPGECVSEAWHQDCPLDDPLASFCDGGRALACYLGALYEGPVATRFAEATAKPGSVATACVAACLTGPDARARR